VARRRFDRALRAESGARPRALDLDEDEGAAVAGDDVELAVAGAGVAGHDLPAAGREAGGYELLREAAGSLAGTGHPGVKAAVVRKSPHLRDEGFTWVSHLRRVAP
jgi:hypothetical protein